MHIPFCHSLCYYCGCSKLVTRHPERAGLYLQKILEKVRIQGKLFDKDRKVGQLHMGGGTPTYLDNQQLERLMAGLSESFQLLTDGSQEYSSELDPRTVDAERLPRLAASGFNRISAHNLGVQQRHQASHVSMIATEFIDDAACRGLCSSNIDLASLGLWRQDFFAISQSLTKMYPFDDLHHLNEGFCPDTAIYGNSACLLVIFASVGQEEI